MASHEEDQIHKKKYKLWEKDPEVTIPLRTLTRWEKNMSDNSHAKLCMNQQQSILNNDGDTCNLTIEDDDTSISSSDNDSSEEINEDNDADTSEVSSCDSDTTSEENSNIVEQDNLSTNIDEQIITSLSTDEDNNDDDINNGSNRNELSLLLYENSSLALDESILILLDLYIKHKWTKSSLQAILDMLQKFLPADNIFPKTVFLLFKFVQDIAPKISVIKHFYCKQCYTMTNKTSKGLNICQSCRIEDKKKFSCYFEFDICEQIKFLFENRSLADKLKPRLINEETEHGISDISDGAEYIRVNARTNRHTYDLTLMLNTDGLSLVKSAKSHCWPLMFIIAELPAHLRESFLTVLGLWYDDNKMPPMNLFLEPFINKLNTCFSQGVDWVHPLTGEMINSKIVVPFIVADAPARAKLQNIQNFNGRYGCNICEIKTKASEKKKRTRVYRYYPFYEESAKLRNSRRMKKQAERALLLNKIHCKGVKGTSSISKLPLIDLGTCVFPEYMHSTLLGVGKHFIHLWIKVNGSWSLKKKIADIDAFITSIQPPSSFNRMPRNLSDYKLFKASEFLHWILFYSLPTLTNYLEEKYFHHWILFVKGLFLLLGNNITSKDLEVADNCFRLFVKQTEDLYGTRYLSYNVHQLLHLTLLVKRWGPLWATSAFPFENINGFLANFVHGSKHLGQELINNMKIFLGVQFLRNKIIYRGNDRFVSVKQDYLIGKSTTVELNEAETLLLRNNNINSEDLLFYDRAKICNLVYTSQLYKITKTNDYTVRIEFNDGSVVYGAIKVFLKNPDEEINGLLKLYKINDTELFVNVKQRITITHILPMEITDSFQLVNFKTVKNISNMIRVGNYLCKQPIFFQKTLL